MGKREIYLLCATIGIEITAVGVGVMLSPTYGWVIAGIGGVVFVVFIVFALRTKEPKQKHLSLVELDANKAVILERIEFRKQYLPELKLTLKDFIGRVEYLANNSEDVL